MRNHTRGVRVDPLVAAEICAIGALRIGTMGEGEAVDANGTSRSVPELLSEAGIV